jgi:gamma-glutamylcyclotransferase (GGCT)/AIG2-like uncharacterized protein YtfP
MATFLAKNSSFIDNASYRGKLYLVSYYPAVVPSENPQDSVRGQVYRLHQPDDVLACLDDYEECGSGFTQPHEYVRQKQQVLLDSGQAVSAWLYVYNRSTDGLQRIMSGDFCFCKNSFKLPITH